jgi:hypothetical protein
MATVGLDEELDTNTDTDRQTLGGNEARTTTRKRGGKPNSKGMSART